MKTDLIKKIYDIDKILEEKPLSEDEKEQIREAVLVREERLAELEKMPTELEKLFEKHKPSFYVGNESEVEKTRRIIENYRSKTVSVMQSANEFRNRFLHILHALELLFGMSETAWTKREMYARLRGTVEFIHAQIAHLEQMDFSIHKSNFEFLPERSFFGLNDSPMREMFYENRRLKEIVQKKDTEIAKLNGVDIYEDISEPNF
jgi:hypothetical protein